MYINSIKYTLKYTPEVINAYIEINILILMANKAKKGIEKASNFSKAFLLTAIADEFSYSDIKHYIDYPSWNPRNRGFLLDEKFISEVPLSIKHPKRKQHAKAKYRFNWEVVWHHLQIIIATDLDSKLNDLHTMANKIIDNISKSKSLNVVAISNTDSLPAKEYEQFLIDYASNIANHMQDVSTLLEKSNLFFSRFSIRSPLVATMKQSFAKYPPICFGQDVSNYPSIKSILRDFLIFEGNMLSIKNQRFDEKYFLKHIKPEKTLSYTGAIKTLTRSDIKKETLKFEAAFYGAFKDIVFNYNYFYSFKNKWLLNYKARTPKKILASWKDYDAFVNKLDALQQI